MSTPDPKINSQKSTGGLQWFNLVLVAEKIPPKDGVITSIFRRNYKVDPLIGVNLPLGERVILVLAGKFNDIKRFSERLSLSENYP